MEIWDAKPGRTQSSMERLVRLEMRARGPGKTSDFQRRVEDFGEALATSRFLANVDEIKLRPHWRGNADGRERILRRLLIVAFGEAIVKNQDRLGEVLVPDWD